MKKLFLLTAILFISLFTSNAQISLGAASGGTLGGDTNRNSTLAPGYFGELSVRLAFKNRLYLSFVPRFESSSYQSKASSPYEFYYYTNAMEFPFHFGRISRLSDKMDIYYDLGPALHWTMTNIYHGSYGSLNGSVQTATKTNPITSGYMPRFNMDLGATVGLNIINHINVFAGFDFGVLNEQTPAYLENFQTAPTHPFFIRLGVGYYLTFRKR